MLKGIITSFTYIILLYYTSVKNVVSKRGITSFTYIMVLRFKQSLILLHLYPYHWYYNFSLTYYRTMVQGTLFKQKKKYIYIYCVVFFLFRSRIMDLRICAVRLCFADHFSSTYLWISCGTSSHAAKIN